MSCAQLQLLLGQWVEEAVVKVKGLALGKCFSWVLMEFSNILLKHWELQAWI